MSLEFRKRSCKLDFSKEAVWERSFLQKKCKDLNLDKEYELYTRRLRNNQLAVFLFVHLAFTIIKTGLLLGLPDYPAYNYVDITTTLTGTVLMSMIMCLNFSQQLALKHPTLIYTTSILGAGMMLVIDVTIHMYHYLAHNWSVLPYYDAYVLYAIYLCFPLPRLKVPILLAAFISLCYIITINIYTFEINLVGTQQTTYILVQVFHFCCVNMVGIFYRLLNELTVRSSFLDRHQFVMEELWLRGARKHEKQLLDSILPPEIARPFQEDIRRRIARAGTRQSENLAIIMGGIMAIQNHPDVSILFADVVNYTYLTTTLSVKSLVNLLHDLYGRFDHAAANFQVQRIKFLGDCYYCVAGLSRPNPDHATACIDMGHTMIAHIREVRHNRGLDIDMRIGIHSGSLMAGVMGAAKLQFDVWGEDVLIAAKLESTGRPGHIHISERTKKMLSANRYMFLPGPPEAQEEPYLSTRNVKTFLIAAIEVKIRSKLNQHQYNPKGEDETRSDTDSALRSEFEKMPLGSFHVDSLKSIWNTKRHHDSSSSAVSQPRLGFIFLHFRDPRIEYNYIRQPDYMLRYSVLLSWISAMILIAVQAVNHANPAQYVYYVDAFLMTGLTLIVTILWYKKLCHWRYSKTRESFSKFSCFIFKITDFLQNSLVCRIFIYMSTILFFFITITMVLLGCEYDEFQILLIESKLYQYEMNKNECFHPWDVTNMVVLMIGLCIVFTRIPWMVKIIISILVALTYMIILCIQYEFVVHDSTSTHPYFQAEIAHGFKICICLVNLYFMERQAEFNSKINYNWKLELVKKQRDAVITNKTISILLQNILPAHVVNIYLTNMARRELYYEKYDMVAVMFASLRNFEMDLANLRLLNEIIIEFDKLLYFYRKDYLVEKIKIVGCTYMAACGLDPRFSGRINEQSGQKTSVILEVSRAQRFLAHIHRKFKLECVENEEVVFVLTTFALDLLRTLWACGNLYRNILDRSVCIGEMSVGISCGEVMAGVVGASQVHYDIWGNPVNMASRMDATGVAGRIQVTEDVALILHKFGIECEYRGMTFVKGRGVLPTYFVGIDDNYEFRTTQSTLHPETSVPSISFSQNSK